MCGIIMSIWALEDLILLFRNDMEFVVWDTNVCDKWLTYRIKSDHTHTTEENIMV